MSSSDSNTHAGDAVVVKEEVSSPATEMGAGSVPPAMLHPAILNTIAHHIGSVSVHHEVAGSSSSSLAAAPSVPEPPAATTLVWAPLPLGVRDFMCHCAAALDAGNVAAVNAFLLAMSCLASGDGDPTQRAAFAFAEALGRRVLHVLLPGLSWALQHQLAAGQQPPPAPACAAARHFFDKLCPFLRVAASAANHAIVAATEGDRFVHVVDLGGAGADQWLDLLRLLAARPDGAPPPFLRLSVVSEQDEFLCHAAGMLTQEAVRLHVPFVFNPVRSHIDRLSAAPGVAAALGEDPREALVITSTLQLHRLIADEASSAALPAVAAADHLGVPAQPHQMTRADELLRALRDLSPKLVVLTEQEADHNSGGLWDRVGNAFDYYSALFGDREAGAGAPRASAERAAVERLVLREEIMDIVAREGSSRRERHERMASWAQRMGVAGFEPAPAMRHNVFVDAELLALQWGADGTLRYWVREEDANVVVYAGVTTPVFSVTAWLPARMTGN